MNRFKNILITGQPGIGKTTLIRKLAEALKDFHSAGFYTAEIRELGIRKGFELISLGGRRGILAHINSSSPHRVSKYGVDVHGFETFLTSIPFLGPTATTVIIDEIGKMECFSAQFRTLVRGILESDKLFVATIALKGDGFIEEIKKRDDVKLHFVNPENRESLAEKILQDIRNVENRFSHG